MVVQQFNESTHLGTLDEILAILRITLLSACKRSNDLAAARVECSAMLVSYIKFVDYPFDLQKPAIDRHQICREINCRAAQDGSSW
jgi:hypothetical protein